jgi:hypothetical protein
MAIALLSGVEMASMRLIIDRNRGGSLIKMRGMAHRM